MNILIMGLPGAGKGTVAEKIAKHYEIGHLSTGEVFRSMMNEETDVAKKLKMYLSVGDLVPDDLTVEILKKEISKKEYANGFILDGFPRTLNQATILEQTLEDKGVPLDKVIFLDVEEYVIIERLSNRYICDECGATFNLLTLPPKEDGKCDECGGTLSRRSDDEPEKIQHRLEVTRKNTFPVIAYYMDLGILSAIEVPDKATPEEVFDLIQGSLEND